MPVTTLNEPISTDVSTASTSSSALTILTIPEGTDVSGRGDLVLRHPVLVELESTPDGYIIRSGHVEEESYGASIEEAYRDFLASLRDRHNSLSLREPRLSSHDRIILERLRTLLAGC
jgi:hypothetical protein